MPSSAAHRSSVRVVLFSGGRGSGALTSQLATNPRISLTLAINGYDDGASTGAVRRFLGDSLGPSDFRKNASRLARLRRSAPDAGIELLDLRLSGDLTERSTAAWLAEAVRAGQHSDPRLAPVGTLAGCLPAAIRAPIAARLDRFAAELDESRRSFGFADCSVGNLVFAGGFLLLGRRFNEGLDDYCHLLGLPRGLIENVTDGTNAFLVAVASDGRLLGSEEDIVDAKRRNRIDDIHLIDRPFTADELERLEGSSREDLLRELERRTPDVRINPRLAPAVEDADLIVYAPGTQHSSLFPSYLTSGLSVAIARNLTAIKLLVTNIQTDAEIAGSSAVDIIERAAFYLKEKGRRSIVTPRLITHYIVNDPGQTVNEAPYVPLGRLESLEDPRLVRIGNYEEGVTGRHDAAKILGPFVDAFVARWNTTQKVAVVLYDCSTVVKVVQSILEMIRAGVRDLPVTVTVFHDGPCDVDGDFELECGFSIRRLEGDQFARDAALRAALAGEGFDYVVLFESSGMYNGEDIAALASHLSLGRLDAVWGSRRLSVRDIHESYRLRYRHRFVLGAISYAGSHLLSLLYLLLYGRYVSDTLSAARAVRVTDALRIPSVLTDKLANQYLLSVLLRRKAEMFEVPVQFFAISPQQVKRTSPLDGLQAIATVLFGRIRHFDGSSATASGEPTDLRSKASRHAQVP